jgi:uncharacterized repeat protein (TIGR03803 family)
MKASLRSFGGIGVLCTALLAPQGLRAQVTPQFLKSFGDGTTLSDAKNPWAALIQGADGALYGAAHDGGTYGAGAVFKLNTDGSAYTVLHNFGAADGQHPTSALLEGADGALYGTAYSGGSSNAGVVFKLNKDGTAYMLLHEFGSVPADGSNPYAALIQTSGGRLYGTTYSGGFSNSGTIFSLSTDGADYGVIHHFAGNTNDGWHPYASLTQGRDGALYGTTYGGAPVAGPMYTSNYSRGTVFRINPSDLTYNVIHRFGAQPDDNGRNPFAPLIQREDGALYGTFEGGGPGDSAAIFKLDPTGANYSIVHACGGAPRGALIQATDGALYGTTYLWSSVFKIDPDGTDYTVIYGPNSSGIAAGLLQGADRAFYGTASQGGAGYGTIFRLPPSGPPSILVQPADQTNSLCTAASFAVGHAGTPPVSFQWWRSGALLTNGDNVSGADTDRLLLSPVSTNDTAFYTVVVANSFGSVTSTPARLTVNPSPCATYTNPVVIHPGWNLMANPLFNPNGDTLDNIILTQVAPALPDKCQLFKFVNTFTNAAAWLPAFYDQAAGTWIPNDVTLSPGEGAFLFNLSSSPFTINFTGSTLPPRSIPYPFTNSSFYLLSCQANEQATYDMIAGAPPSVGTYLNQWNGSNYDTYAFMVPKGADRPTWNGSPSISIGESVWIHPYPRLPRNPPPAPVYLALAASNHAANIEWSVVPVPFLPGSSTLQFSTDLLNWRELTNLGSAWPWPPSPLRVSWPLNPNSNAPSQLFFRVNQQY